MPEKVILFGSYGTGKHGYNSDIDLLIVKETEKRFVDRVVELVRLIRKRFGVKYPVEPLIYTPDEFKRAKDINSSFIKNILLNGIVLYGKK
jgi:predicted nucleotidyltransferase